MKEEISNLQFYHSYQKYLNNPFTLSNLIDMIRPYQIFQIQTNQIYFNESNNFTFASSLYTIKILEPNQNQLRILYYSILCYIFQICDQKDHEIYFQNFVNYILNGLQVIFPYKYKTQFDKTDNNNINNLIGSNLPLLTTNQMKSCLIKFLSLLKQKSVRQKKIIVQQLMIIPQIDYILMSIFKMIIRRNYMENKADQQKLLNYFGIKINVIGDSFILNDQCEINIIKQINHLNQQQTRNQKDQDQLNYAPIQDNVNLTKFMIKKINKYKQINHQHKPHNTTLLRRQTIQSIGGVDERYDESFLESKEKEVYHFQSEQLNNAKFVKSFKLQKGQQLVNVNIFNQNKQKENQIIQKDSLEVRQRKQTKFKTFYPSNFNFQLKNRFNNIQKKSLFVQQNTLKPIINIYEPIRQSKNISIIQTNRQQKTYHLKNHENKRLNNSNQQLTQFSCSSNHNKSDQGFRPWKCKNKKINELKISAMMTMSVKNHAKNKLNTSSSVLPSKTKSSHNLSLYEQVKDTIKISKSGQNSQAIDTIIDQKNYEQPLPQRNHSKNYTFNYFTYQKHKNKIQ